MINSTDLNTIITLLGIFVGLLVLFFGTRYFSKKKVGRDDNSVNIGNNTKIDNSFNKKS